MSYIKKAWYESKADSKYMVHVDAIITNEFTNEEYVLYTKFGKSYNLPVEVFSQTYQIWYHKNMPLYVPQEYYERDQEFYSDFSISIGCFGPSLDINNGVYLMKYLTNILNVKKACFNPMSKCDPEYIMTTKEVLDYLNVLNDSSFDLKHKTASISLELQPIGG